MTLSIQVDIAAQTLELKRGDEVLKRYPVSTAKNGPGEQRDSGKTPRGKHIVRARIGAGAAENTVFVGRRPTGEIYSAELDRAQPGRDWILTRILWLSGTERGKNRLGAVDTMQRYIYIHGCPEHCPMGVPESHGCIRMRNRDVIELFEQVPVGTPVMIEE